MAAHRIAPQNIEERFVYYGLAGSWLWYAVGGLYLAGPALGVALLAIYAWRKYAKSWRAPPSWPAAIPIGVWMWIAGMLGMLLALLVAHVGFDLGVGQTLKSTIGWMKGWALLAAFPLAGACLRIRPAVVARAMAWLSLHTLVLMPVLVAAALAHLPSRLFVSPIQAVGGPGPEFFSVYLYTIDPSNGAMRWQFIAPWAPAAGMIGNMIFVLASCEVDRRFRTVMIVAVILMSLMSKSRMAILFLVFFPFVLWTVSLISRPAMLAAVSIVSVAVGILMEKVVGMIQDSVQAFRSARADSTRVREALGRAAVNRWREEAPIWGHGIVERGTHFVEFMPIGSHHTWFGLLFVKGAVGVACLAAPLLWSIMELSLLAQVSKLGRTGLSVVLLLIYYSAGENLEILAYLFWPASVILGAALQEAASFRRS